MGLGNKTDCPFIHPECARRWLPKLVRPTRNASVLSGNDENHSSEGNNVWSWHDACIISSKIRGLAISVAMNFTHKRCYPMIMCHRGRCSMWSRTEYEQLKQVEWVQLRCEGRRKRLQGSRKERNHTILSRLNTVINYPWGIGLIRFYCTTLYCL